MAVTEDNSMSFKKLLLVIFLGFLVTNLSACGQSAEQKKMAEQKAADKQALSGDLSKPSPHREWR
jgi:hypothetical protein